MRELFGKQHGKRAQELWKYASQHLYHIHWSLPSQLSWKKSLFLTCQILGLLVNTLPADEKYSLLNRHNLTIPIQMELSQKHKTFSQFLGEFLKCNINIKYFEKKDNLHRFCASDITASENVVRWMSKKYRFRESFDKQRGQPAEALLKSVLVHFYPIDWSLKSQLGWKKSLLFICQILGLLFNTLAADEKYLFLKRDNLTVPIQMQLSQKKKISCSNLEI